MTGLLVVLSLLIGMYAAAALLTQATLGVGVLCFGILLAILARINQASEQHKAIIEAMRYNAPPPPPPPPAD